ncbi:hypothetical protein [Aliivibrio fischeri]|uniref:hypothetical protein n=1 Tax=Aliivibrio fischeri TaxID=668 RepID=UPI0007C45F6D|nr:hypothetical protein [Aliivibrio fischeri]
MKNLMKNTLLLLTLTGLVGCFDDSQDEFDAFVKADELGEKIDCDELISIETIIPGPGPVRDIHNNIYSYLLSSKYEFKQCQSELKELTSNICSERKVHRSSSLEEKIDSYLSSSYTYFCQDELNDFITHSGDFKKQYTPPTKKNKFIEFADISTYIDPIDIQSIEFSQIYNQPEVFRITLRVTGHGEIALHYNDKNNWLHDRNELAEIVTAATKKYSTPINNSKDAK